MTLAITSATVLAIGTSIGCGNIGERLQAPLPTMDERVVTDEGVALGNWPAWRGGTAHGVSPAKSLPLNWSPRENIAWKTAIDGVGNSSPVVWDDQVFLTSVVGAGHRARLTLLSIDRRDGQILWQQRLGQPVGETHPRNGHASATVATDGQHVYAYFGAKGLFCFTTNGERLWHRPLPDQLHEWGVAACPVLAGSLVIQLCDSQQESYLVAFDKLSGDEIWRTPRDSNGCWTTPVIVPAGDGPTAPWQLIVNGTGSRDGSSGYVRAYNPWTGRPLWHVAGTSDIVCPTAIAGGGMIVCSSGPSAPILAINLNNVPSESTGTGQSTEVSSQWQLPMGGPNVPTGVIYRERLYLIDDDGVASCRDVANGQELWRERLASSVSASLIAGADRIYVAGESGEVYVLAAKDEFQLLATNSLHEAILATPAAAGDELYIRTKSHLYCIREVAQPPADASPSDSPAGT